MKYHTLSNIASKQCFAFAVYFNDDCDFVICRRSSLKRISYGFLSDSGFLLNTLPGRPDLYCVQEVIVLLNAPSELGVSSSMDLLVCVSWIVFSSQSDSLGGYAWLCLQLSKQLVIIYINSLCFKLIHYFILICLLCFLDFMILLLHYCSQANL